VLAEFTRKSLAMVVSVGMCAAEKAPHHSPASVTDDLVEEGEKGLLISPGIFLLLPFPLPHPTNERTNQFRSSALARAFDVCGDPWN